MVLKCVKQAIFLLSSLWIGLSAYAGGEFGGVWVETLNFSHRGIGIKTGSHGNVRSIEGKPFDIDAIHEELMKENKRVIASTGKSHNVVVAGFSLLMRDTDGNCEAFYIPLKEGNSTLAFISGIVEKEYSQRNTTFIGASEEFIPQNLLQKFAERLNHQSEDFPPLNHVAASTYYEEWKNAQKTLLWGAIAKLGQLAIDESHESIYTYERAIKQALDDKINATNKSFGSSIDSEQFLLSYFEKPLQMFEGSQVPTVYVKYNDLVGKYRTEKLRALRTNFFKELNATEDIEKMNESMDKFKTTLDQFAKMEEVGCILHLHSTNEVCCCCSYSFTQELRYGLLSDLKKIMKDHNNPNSLTEPFFSILFSASQILPEAEKGRPGIGQSSTFEELEDGVVPIQEIVNKGLFLQKHLK